MIKLILFIAAMFAQNIWSMEKRPREPDIEDSERETVSSKKLCLLNLNQNPDPFNP